MQSTCTATFPINKKRLVSILLAALVFLLAGCETAPLGSSGQCNLSQLTPAVTWEGTQDDALLGHLTLTNYTGQPCPLSGSPALTLLDATQQPLAVIFQPGDPNLPDVLQPDQSLQMTFTWKNWCGQPIDGELTLQLAFSDTPGILMAAFQDPNGRPQTDTPACLDAARSSILTTMP